MDVLTEKDEVKDLTAGYLKNDKRLTLATGIGNMSPRRFPCGC
ncbi:hypothetical protein S1OALGB6SA_242 [Olavius algarvensis spirochete endosymbiont]|nr:hypothetical protein S1OALGB6SA_242 [Olavius algarvensis spirochete endosymbiont]